MSGETKQRISNLEAEIAIARQRITDLANENRHLRECHPNMRDQFAMAAIGTAYKIHKIGQVYDDLSDAEGVAIYAYYIADAMMEARDAKNN